MRLKRLLAIRADGGVRVGMGHLYKMANLASRLRQISNRISFLFFVKEDAQGIQWLREKGFRVISLPKGIRRDLEPAWMVKHFPVSGHALFALDIFDVSRKYVGFLKVKGYKVITFENRNPSKRIADATFNVLTEGIRNRVRKYPEGGTVFYGPRYRVFHASYHTSHLSNGRSNDVQTVSISLGGGEDHGFTRMLLEEFNKLKREMKICAVTGPAQASIPRMKTSQWPHVKILGPQTSLANLLSHSDLAITAGGGTLCETAYLGIPTVAFAKREHQKRNIREFSRRGSAIAVPSMNRKSARKVTFLVSRLLDDTKRRMKMSRQGKKLCDGRGAERVARVIQNLFEGKEARQ